MTFTLLASCWSRSSAQYSLSEKLSPANWLGVARIAGGAILVAAK